VTTGAAGSALVFGISGQDGSLLAQRLLDENWIVHGASRDAELNEFRNLGRLGIREKVRLHSANPIDFRSVIQVIERTQPSEIYNLSGQSSVGLSFEHPVETFESISVATVNILESIRILKAPVRFYNAASSECFGDTGSEGADEYTPFRPRSPYAVAKAAAFWTVANYRTAYGLFAASGILFNHESPLRPERFVTRKIVRSAARIARGEMKGPLRLGNLAIRRDWGWAPEFVDAICRILRHDVADDFVIATGKSASLQDFAAAAFAAFDLDWREHVVSVPELFRPSEISVSLGRPERARQRLGWVAGVRMPELVRRLVDAESSESPDR
jgi:GDPmannose 4,6-dehydratase